MDFQKAGILLEKIHALFKNMSADSDSVSEIEKDLMRAYLRQFYEFFLPHGESPAEAAAPVELPPMITRKPPVKKIEPVIEEPEDVEEDEEEEDEDTFTPLPPPPPKKKEKEKKVETPEQKTERPEPPKMPRMPEAAGEEEEEEEIENLFEHHQARELSEKLSELPIQDLGKAMGLNEKIFTINELFNGDQEVFKQTILALNSLPSFEEAKNFLVREVAVRYNWAHGDKKNKAKNFIKLVRRRYIG